MPIPGKLKKVEVLNKEMLFFFLAIGLGIQANAFQIRVKTNNGIKSQNKSFKYEYLRKKCKNTISRMATVLIDQFFTEIYNRLVLYKIQKKYMIPS